MQATSKFVLAGLVALVGAAASAQVPNPPPLALRAAFGQVMQPAPTSGALGPASRPTVSPYLNLLRSSGNPGVNYYGIVRPQIAVQQNLRALDQGLTQTKQAVASQAASKTVSDLPTTGKRVGFLNTGSYFPLAPNRK